MFLPGMADSPSESTAAHSGQTALIFGMGALRGRCCERVYHIRKGSRDARSRRTDPPVNDRGLNEIPKMRPNAARRQRRTTARTDTQKFARGQRAARHFFAVAGRVASRSTPAARGIAHQKRVPHALANIPIALGQMAEISDC